MALIGYIGRYMKTGEKIKRLRESKKISRESLSKKMNTTGHTIYRLERGDMKITEDWLDRFAKALGCSSTDLLKDSFSNSKSISESTIDLERLEQARLAVEKALSIRGLKLPQKEVTKLLIAVYEQGMKYELQGESTSPKVIAELLIARGTG